MTSIIAITPDTRFLENVREVFGSNFQIDTYWPQNDVDIGMAATSRYIERIMPLVTLIGPGIAAPAMISLIEDLDRSVPEVAIVAVSDSDTTELIELFRAGATNAAYATTPYRELKAMVAQAAERASNRRVNVRVAAPESRQARSVIVLSPKGGVGKTSLCTNVAVELAARDPEHVALVDLDLQFGDISSTLNVSAENNIADVGIDGSVNTSALKVSLTTHDSGLFVLAAPDNLARADDVTAVQVKSVVAAMQDAFPLSIFDTAAGVDDNALAAAEQATDLLFLVTTDVSSVRAVKAEIDAFNSLGMVTQDRHLIINRANSRLGMTQADIERTLDMPAAATIPSSTALASAANQGVSLATLSPRDSALKAFADIADLFMPRAAPEQQKRWWK